MKLLSSALAGSALLVLTGCVTPQSAANSNPGDNTTAGTIMGGMIGAIAGMESVEQRGPQERGYYRRYCWGVGRECNWSNSGSTSRGSAPRSQQ